ncbi:MAG: hypothetical protein R2873_35685 [Caldilineaceae bacterium]
MSTLNRLSILGLLFVVLMLSACQPIPIVCADVTKSMPCAPMRRPTLLGAARSASVPLIGGEDSERLGAQPLVPSLTIPNGQCAKPSPTPARHLQRPELAPADACRCLWSGPRRRRLRRHGNALPAGGVVPGYLFSAPMYNVLAEHYASHGVLVWRPITWKRSITFSEMWMTLIDRPGDVTRTLDYAEALTAAGWADGRPDRRHGWLWWGIPAGAIPLAAAGASTTYKPTEDAAPPSPSTIRSLSSARRSCPSSLTWLRADLADAPDGLWPSFGDPRVTAIVPMAGDSYLFGEAGLAQIDVPMMVMGGSAGSGTRREADPHLCHAVGTQKSLVTFVGAEHMIFNTLRATALDVRTCSRRLLLADPVWDRARALDRNVTSPPPSCSQHSAATRAPMPPFCPMLRRSPASNTQLPWRPALTLLALLAV